MTGVLIRDRKGEDTWQPQKIRPCEAGDKDWREAVGSQGAL